MLDCRLGASDTDSAGGFTLARKLGLSLVQPHCPIKLPISLLGLAQEKGHVYVVPAPYNAITMTILLGL